MDIPEETTRPVTHKALLAVLSGLMLSASFPPGKMSFLVWFALVPLLKSLDSETPSNAFRLGLVAGTTHFLTLIYWIVVVLAYYGGLNSFVSLGPLFLMSLYLALYPAFFSGLTILLARSRFVIIMMASLWVGLEFIRAKVLTGFPWCLLGHTQYEHLHLIQIADILGVYGISFFIVLVNGLIYHILSGRSCKGPTHLKWEVVFVALTTCAILGYGHYRLSESLPNKGFTKNIKATIIQANIDQSIKWDPIYQTRTMEIYKRLTRTSYDFDPELIVWPETAVPFFFQDNPRFSPEIYSLARESGGVLIFGSPAYKEFAGAINYHNRAYLITPDDESPQIYDKTHLVPFGEYIPLKKFLFFIHRLVPAAGDFEAGHEIVPLGRGDFSVGVLICFEAVFPELARTYARKGADILVNLTNDAWFGSTSAPHQHLSMAIFRAVENKRPMIRAANTGFSAFIRPSGEVVKKGELFQEATLHSTVDLPGSSLTFYAKFGDLFASFLLIITLAGLFFHIRVKRVDPG